MPKQVQLTEVAALTASPAGVMTGRRFWARLIAADVQGSCGFYPTSTLTEAADNKVFSAGLASFIDHPGVTEQMDRPERSVRDLAGRLVTDAVMRPDGLYAEIEVWPHVAPAIEAMADAIGMSIRAMGTVEQGDVNGSPGMVVTSLSSASSVDFVTKAGAGGKLVSLLESARPARVIERAVAHGVAEATANDIREALNVVIRTAYGDENTWPWLRDFDDTTCWFEISTSDSENTYAQTYTLAEDGTATLTGARTEVRARTEYVPVDPVVPAAIEADAGIGNTVKCKTCGHMASAHKDIAAGNNMGACSMKGCDCKAMATKAAESAAPTVPVIPAGLVTQESLEDHMAPKIEVDEAEHARVTAAAARVSALEVSEAAAVARATGAESELTLLRARNTARPIATTLVGESESLPPMVATRVIEAAVAGVTLEQGGTFDEAAFRTAVEAARTAAETEVAQIAEALGVGKVTNFGHTSTNQGEVSEADLDAILADAFGRTVKEA